MNLSDRWAAWRNALIANPNFQHWAARNPFTRGIAEKKAKASFDLVAGFVYSQVLAASVETTLLETVRTAPVREADFAAKADLPPEAAQRLLRAAASLNLVRRQSDGRYALGEAGAALLGNSSVFAMVRHHAAFYRDMADPVGLLRARDRGTELARFWHYDASAHPDDASAYSSLMAQTQALIARNVLDAYDFGRHRTIMDVGGGAGAFLLEVAARHARPDLVLVDLPAVAAIAQARIAGRPVATRMRIEPRDMLRESLPNGADLITLIRVLHDHDDRPVRLLLSSIRRTLAPGGTLLIGEPMAGVRGTEAVADAYFGFYLWAMGRGTARRPDELAGLLREAGFSRIRQRPTAQPMLVSVLVAQ
jgi:demethylspheroidene O-methyltransferase